MQEREVREITASLDDFEVAEQVRITNPQIERWFKEMKRISIDRGSPAGITIAGDVLTSPGTT